VDLELADKVAVVTGASKGIGFAVVEERAAEGAKVIAGARHLDPLEGSIAGVIPLAVDLADPAGPEQLVAHAVERLGHVDVLVNNVGAVHVRLNGFLSLADADFDASLNVHFAAAKAALVNEPSRCRRSWAHREFASRASHPVPWRRACGWERAAWRRPSVKRREQEPTPCVRR
jgi:NAD(P)-dependent dehydrogenase (short-subunit alcohol dehydrogenase family)